MVLFCLTTGNPVGNNQFRLVMIAVVIQDVTDEDPIQEVKVTKITRKAITPFTSVLDLLR